MAKRKRPRLWTSKVEFANKEDYKTQFWKRNYAVTLSEHGPVVIVNADNEQDAVDSAIDHADERGYEGLFLSDDDIVELEEEGNLEDYVSGGNAGRYLSSLNVYIEQILGPKRYKK